MKTENKNLVLIDLNVANDCLKKYCNCNSRRGKASWRNVFYQVSSLMSQEHNCTPYYFTLTWPAFEGSLDNEWSKVANEFSKIKIELSKMCLIAGGIISLEAHKNTTLKSKRGKNTKAGRPHAHMLLWLYHDFLNPSEALITCAFEDAGMHCTLKRLQSYNDTSKVLTYVVKECLDEDLQNYVRCTTSWNGSVNLWYNNSDCSPVLKRLESTIGSKNLYITQEMGSIFPTARRTDDITILLAEIFVRLFARQGLGVRESMVYRRRAGTQFSWEPWQTLEAWVGSHFSMKLPAAYLSKLRQSITWIQTEGGISKRAPRLELFPRICLSFNYVEFSDCLYDFVTGKTVSKDSVLPTLAVGTNINKNWDDCVAPVRVLGLLATVMKYGYDGRDTWVKDRDRMRDLPSVAGKSAEYSNVLQERVAHGYVKDYLKWFAKLRKVLERFGGVFHPELNRKKNKALFLVGVASSYKTFLAKLLLEAVYGSPHIDTLPRSKSRFNLSSLRKEDGSPYVLLLDDLRWDEMGMFLADFLNLLDGTEMSTEVKYERSRVGPLKGSVLITGNKTAIDADLEMPYVDALDSRIHTETLHKPSGVAVPTEEELEKMCSEGIGFAILANVFFLNSKSAGKVAIPASFRKNSYYSESSDYYGFVGNSILQDLLKVLDTGSSTF